MHPTINRPNLTPEVSLPNKKVKESSDDKETTMNVKQIQQNINPARSTITKPNLAPEVSLSSKKVKESSDEDDGSESDSSVEGTYHFGNDASDEEETTTVQSTTQRENATVANLAKPTIRNQTDNTKQKSIIFHDIKNERENKITTYTPNQKENKSALFATDLNASLVSTTEHAANLERIKDLEKELQEVLLFNCMYIYG